MERRRQDLSPGCAIHVADIVALIMAAPKSSPFVVGVDGPSGSGKSTLGDALAQALGEQATVLHMDDFVSWHDFAGWWPRFDAEVLSPLLAGQTTRFRVRDWDGDEFGDSLGPWKSAQPTPFLVLEGVTCTRRAVSTRLDLAIWVEAPKDLRLRRGLLRDGESHRQLWLDWMQVEADFFDGDDTRSRADLRLSADGEVVGELSWLVEDRAPG